MHVFKPRYLQVFFCSFFFFLQPIYPFSLASYLCCLQRSGAHYWWGQGCPGKTPFSFVNCSWSPWQNSSLLDYSSLLAFLSLGFTWALVSDHFGFLGGKPRNRFLAALLSPTLNRAASIRFKPPAFTGFSWGKAFPFVRQSPTAL